ncbi:hypothetical protein [Legionella qingyii]|uniref:hypothetical protein n=1 Tax=Legionella qingyii TaxID=2184757 RepID=UPI001F0CCEAE|nr:hypothetical protein [Legionella qingyii]
MILWVVKYGFYPHPNPLPLWGRGKIEAFQLEGHKAVLTEQGVEILKLSRQITRAAKNVENAAINLKSIY